MSLSEMDAKILKLQAQLNATNEILDSFIHGTEVDQFFLLIMGMVIFRKFLNFEYTCTYIIISIRITTKELSLPFVGFIHTARANE